jgi:hypothetical protein
MDNLTFYLWLPKYQLNFMDCVHVYKMYLLQSMYLYVIHINLCVCVYFLSFHEPQIASLVVSWVKGEVLQHIKHSEIILYFLYSPVGLV